MTKKATEKNTKELQKILEKSAKSIFKKLDENATVKVSTIETDTDRVLIKVEVTAEDPGILIGFKAKNINSLQYYLRLCLIQELKKLKENDCKYSVLLDINDYRQKQDDKLVERAKEAIEQVRVLEEPYSLPPMGARQRRIVHMEVAKTKDLVSESSGEEPERYVVIQFKK